MKQHRLNVPRSSHRGSANRVVDEVTRIFGKATYLAVPSAWFRQIVDRQGRPDHVAITILAYIVGWYRATKERTKKFAHDKLQLNRGQLAKELNSTADGISAALTRLEKRGLITREYRD